MQDLWKLRSTDTAVGEYAAFFRLRVDIQKDKFLLYTRLRAIPTVPLSLPARAMRKARKLMKLTGSAPAHEFRTSMQLCARCHSLSPCHEYSFDDLLGLYRDYRKDSYNRDRISVEPGYAQIAEHVGANASELKNRNAAVDSFLRRNAGRFAGGTMIDYGGSDGRFLPPFVLEQFEVAHIYDASEAPPHPSVDPEKVRKIAEPQAGSYAFVTCMHVLEHVGSPRAVFLDALRLLRPGGVAYFEIPHDLTSSMREDYGRRIIDTPVLIHEHINTFDLASIPALAASLDGVELLDAAEDIVDFGWAKPTIGRFLVRKTA